MKVRIIAYEPEFLDRYEQEAVAGALKFTREENAVFVDLPNRLDEAFTRLAELGTIMLVMPGEDIVEATDGELDQDHPIDGENWTVVVKPD
jgi:hypothetical protein